MFEQNGLSIIENAIAATGTCAISPDWRKTTGLYYCSQLTLTDPSYLGTLWQQMHLDDSEIRKLKKEVKRLDKLAKERFREINQIKNVKCQGPGETLPQALGNKQI